MVVLLLFIYILGRFPRSSSQQASNLRDMKFKLSIDGDLYHHSLRNTVAQHRAILKPPLGKEKSQLSKRSSSTSFSCVSFNTTFSPEIFCSNVVDYPFYLPANMSLDQLEAEARERASIYPTSYLDGKCLSSAKRNICASLYLQCVSNVIPGNTSTYQRSSENSSVLLPFIPPCRSLCEVVDHTCSNLLSRANLAPECNLLNPYDSRVPLYSNVTERCNHLSSSNTSQQLVSDIHEPYIGQVCREMIFEYYVSPVASSNINPAFAPWQPPFYLQSLLEERVTQIAAQIPRFFPSSCLLAQREMLCSSVFIKPYPNRLLSSSLKNQSVYLPSFPDRAICERYQQECQSTLLTLAPSLAINCSMKTGDIFLYPNGSQVISRISFDGYEIPLSAPSNSMTQTNLSSVQLEQDFSVQCPYAYSPSPEETRAGAFPIPNTACSLSCPIAFYTSEEYDWLYTQTVISVYGTLVFALFQLLHLLLLKPSKQNLFLVCFIVATFLFNLFQAIQIIVIPNRFETICDNATTAYSLYDPDPENSTGYGFCAMNSIANLYLWYFYWWVLFSLSCEIWCRVYWGIKQIGPYRRYYMSLSGIILFGDALLWQFYDHGDVNSIGSVGFFCAWTSEHYETRFYVQGVLGLLLFTASFCMIAHSVYLCIRTSYSVQETIQSSPVKRGGRGGGVAGSVWKTYSMLILFLLLEIVVVPISFLYFQVYLGYITFPIWAKSEHDWSVCTFEHFVNIADDSYLQICGTTPSERVPLLAWFIPYAVGTYANSLVLLLITCNKEVKSFWWKNWVFLMEFLAVPSLLVWLGLCSSQRVTEMFAIDQKKRLKTIITPHSQSQALSQSFTKPTSSSLLRRSFSSMSSTTSSTVPFSSGIATGNTQTMSQVLLQLVTGSIRRSSKISVIYEQEDAERGVRRGEEERDLEADHPERGSYSEGAEEEEGGSEVILSEPKGITRSPSKEHTFEEKINTSADLVTMIRNVSQLSSRGSSFRAKYPKILPYDEKEDEEEEEEKRRVLSLGMIQTLDHPQLTSLQVETIESIGSAEVMLFPDYDSVFSLAPEDVQPAMVRAESKPSQSSSSSSSTSSRSFALVRLCSSSSATYYSKEGLVSSHSQFPAHRALIPLDT